MCIPKQGIILLIKVTVESVILVQEKFEREL